MKFSLPIVLVLITAALTVAAQTNDDADLQRIEAERQRLGNQRIQQEMEIRAREEEQRRLEEEQRLALQSQEPARQQEVQPQEAAPASRETGVARAPAALSGADHSSDMSRALEQLRTLGELKDAGYITEKEHEKLKKKILDDLM